MDIRTLRDTTLNLFKPYNSKLFTGIRNIRQWMYQCAPTKLKTTMRMRLNSARNTTSLGTILPRDLRSSLTANICASEVIDEVIE
jgi:hypothetical protein